MAEPITSTGLVEPPKEIAVWVCPVCGSWAGSSTMGNLAAMPNHRTSMRNLSDEDPSEWGKITGYRNVCQECRAQGVEGSERQLVTYLSLPALKKTLADAVESEYQEEERRGHVAIRRRT